MIWAILLFLGVPLWLCAAGILTLVARNRSLRSRPGNATVRVLRPGKKRWTRANALWVSDVFAWRASPAAWSEDLRQVREVTTRIATSEEAERLHGLGNDVVVARMAFADGGSLDVAAATRDRSALLGPRFSELGSSR